MPSGLKILISAMEFSPLDFQFDKMKSFDAAGRRSQRSPIFRENQYVKGAFGAAQRLCP
jgi:hypothetical protein